MKIDIFLNELKQILEFDDVLTIDTHLPALETWDSLAWLSVINLLDEHGVNIEISAIASIETVGQLYSIVNSSND